MHKGSPATMGLDTRGIPRVELLVGRLEWKCLTSIQFLRPRPNQHMFLERALSFRNISFAKHRALSYTIVACFRQTELHNRRRGRQADRATGDGLAPRRQDGGSTSPLCRFRWTETPEPVELQRITHRTRSQRIAHQAMQSGHGVMCNPHPGLDLQRLHCAPGDKSGVALLDRQPVIMTSL